MNTSPLNRLARHDRIRREVEQRSELIPSLPDVVTAVLKLLNDRKGAELADFERHLRNDAALVARMLRVVNSPFYGLVHHVTSIRDAVMVLGFRSLRSLVLAATTAKYLERNYSCYGHSKRGLWIHSISAASGSRTLAAELKLHPDVCEEVFVIGLLHDIGKMLLGPFLAQEDIDLSDAGGDVTAMERDYLGMDHQEAGALIASRWNLSPVVQDVLRHHHGGVPADENLMTTAVVRLADTLSHDLGHGFKEGHRFVSATLAKDLAEIGLSGEEWGELRPRLAEAMESSIAALGNLGS